MPQRPATSPRTIHLIGEIVWAHAEDWPSIRQVETELRGQRLSWRGTIRMTLSGDAIQCAKALEGFVTRLNDIGSDESTK